MTHDAAPHEVDWPFLEAEALAGRPERLFRAVSVREHQAWLEAQFLGLQFRDVPPVPLKVRATVSELRRVRQGRPRKSDALRLAACAWQVHETWEIYRAALASYQMARMADLTGNAAELPVGDTIQVAYIDSRRRLPSVVRGGGLSPKELALEAAAHAVGRTAESVRKLLFGSKRPRR